MAAQLEHFAISKCEELSRLDGELQALAAAAFVCGVSAPTTKPLDAVPDNIRDGVRAALGAGLFPDLPASYNPADCRKAALCRHPLPAPSQCDASDKDDEPLIHRLKRAKPQPAAAEQFVRRCDAVYDDLRSEMAVDDRFQLMSGLDPALASHEGLLRGRPGTSVPAVTAHPPPVAPLFPGPRSIKPTKDAGIGVPWDSAQFLTSARVVPAVAGLHQMPPSKEGPAAIRHADGAVPHPDSGAAAELSASDASAPQSYKLEKNYNTEDDKQKQHTKHQHSKQQQRQQPPRSPEANLTEHDLHEHQNVVHEEPDASPVARKRPPLWLAQLLPSRRKLKTDRPEVLGSEHESMGKRRQRIGTAATIAAAAVAVAAKDAAVVSPQRAVPAAWDHRGASADVVEDQLPQLKVMDEREGLGGDGLDASGGVHAGDELGTVSASRNSSRSPSVSLPVSVQGCSTADTSQQAREGLAKQQGASLPPVKLAELEPTALARATDADNFDANTNADTIRTALHGHTASGAAPEPEVAQAEVAAEAAQVTACNGPQRKPEKRGVMVDGAAEHEAVAEVPPAAPLGHNFKCTGSCSEAQAQACKRQEPRPLDLTAPGTTPSKGAVATSSAAAMNVSTVAREEESQPSSNRLASISDPATGAQVKGTPLTGVEMAGLPVSGVRPEGPPTMAVEMAGHSAMGAEIMTQKAPSESPSTSQLHQLNHQAHTQPQSATGAHDGKPERRYKPVAPARRPPHVRRTRVAARDLPSTHAELAAVAAAWAAAHQGNSSGGGSGDEGGGSGEEIDAGASRSSDAPGADAVMATATISPASASAVTTEPAVAAAVPCSAGGMDSATAAASPPASRCRAASPGASRQPSYNCGEAVTGQSDTVAAPGPPPLHPVPTQLFPEAPVGMAVSEMPYPSGGGDAIGPATAPSCRVTGTAVVPDADVASPGCLRRQAPAGGIDIVDHSPAPSLATPMSTSPVILSSSEAQAESAVNDEDEAAQAVAVAGMECAEAEGKSAQECAGSGPGERDANAGAEERVLRRTRSGYAFEIAFEGNKKGSSGEAADEVQGDPAAAAAHATGPCDGGAGTEQEEDNAGMSEVERGEWRRRKTEIERQRAEATAEREAARRARLAQQAATVASEELERRIRQRLADHHQQATAAAAEAATKEDIRARIRDELQERFWKALEEHSLSRFLRQLELVPKGGFLRTEEQRNKALKAAKIRFHPDKVTGNLQDRVFAEEVSKLLNSWTWIK